MYAVIDDFSPPLNLTGPIIIDDNTSYVSFRLNERFQRICLWINQVSSDLLYRIKNRDVRIFCMFCVCDLQNFLLPTDIEPEHLAELDDIRLFLTSVYDGSPVIIWFSDKEDSKICTENMDLAGDLIHSLASFLNIEDLKVYMVHLNEANILPPKKFNSMLSNFRRPHFFQTLPID